MDEGLVDVRGDVDLWGTLEEQERFKHLASEHPNLSTIEIGEMVLAENIPIIL